MTKREFVEAWVLRAADPDKTQHADKTQDLIKEALAAWNAIGKQVDEETPLRELVKLIGMDLVSGLHGLRGRFGEDQGDHRKGIFG